jgi:hypothetical protein
VGALETYRRIVTEAMLLSDTTIITAADESRATVREIGDLEILIIALLD